MCELERFFLRCVSELEIRIFVKKLLKIIGTEKVVSYENWR